MKKLLCLLVLFLTSCSQQKDYNTYIVLDTIHQKPYIIENGNSSIEVKEKYQVVLGRYLVENKYIIEVTEEEFKRYQLYKKMNNRIAIDKDNDKLK